MLQSYSDRKTEACANGEFVKEFSGFIKQAQRRLTVLDAADSLRALRNLKSNRLEALSGDRQGEYSIRINRQWRICFEWPSDATGPRNVEITDYH